MCDKIETELDKLKQRLETMSEEEAKQVNACMDSKGNVKLFSLVELYEMQRRNTASNNSEDGQKLGIPAVQRGLVWEPTKIVNLWDSIVKGYPIGIMQCYNEGHNNLALIDGQQRLNAICLGFKDSEEASLWVRINTKNIEESIKTPKFMVCTSRHPWGFSSSTNSTGTILSPYNASERRKKNRILLKVEDNERLEDEFQLAKLQSHGMPLTDEAGIEYYKMEEVLSEDSSHNSDSIIGRLRQSAWVKKVKDRDNRIIPVAIIENINPTADVLRCIFARINRGGTRLSAADEIYSAVCVYGSGFNLKEKNNSLSKQFLPPARLTKLAIRMAKSMNNNQYYETVGIETLCKWFEKGDNGVMEPRTEEGENLRTLYEGGALAECKNKFKDCLKGIDNNDSINAVPSYIFLRDDDDNWLYVIFMLIYKYTDIVCSNAKYWHLLCMLPDVLCGTPEKVGREEFCRGFYNATVASNAPFKTLLQLMAVGCVAASMGNTFMWPYPCREHELLTLSKNKKVDSEYRTYWLDIYRSIRGRRENNILFYYQREYVNKMLNAGIYDPASTATWQGKQNKPWDMDHVIPEKWWSNDNDDVRNEVGNMQIMYFSHNRVKQDNQSGVPEMYNSDLKTKYFRIAGSDCYNFNKGNIGTNDQYEKWPVLISARQEDIIKSIYNELYINDLIFAIQSIENCNDSIPIIEAARMRYSSLKDLAREFNLDIWGICVYEWKQRNMSTRETKFLPIHDINFYSTLGSWLIVGKEVELSLPNISNGVKVLQSIQASLSANEVGKVVYKIGFSRPIGMSSNDWLAIVSNIQDQDTNNLYSDATPWFLHACCETTDLQEAKKSFKKLKL